MSNEAVLKYQESVRKAAVHISIEWPDSSVSDIEQDIWVRLLESPATVETLDTWEPDMVLRFMYKVAKQVAAKDKQAIRISKGDFRYSVGEVKKKLDEGAMTGLGAGNMGSWSVDEASAATGEGYTDTTGSTASFMADLSSALFIMKDKNERHFNLLIAKFVLGETLNNVDEVANRRALRSLVDKMNFGYKKDMGDFEGPGLRKALTRSQAQALREHQDVMDYSRHFGNGHITS